MACSPISHGFRILERHKQCKPANEATPGYLRSERVVVNRLQISENDHTVFDNTTTSMSTFRYVLVPANSSAGIVIKTGKTAGGLERDELVQSAKDYFFQQSDAAEHVIALKNATPEVRNALAEKFRKQNSNPQIQSLPNDQILQLMEANTNPSCEIVALTVPTKGNGHEAVSLYISPFTDGARSQRTGVRDGVGPWTQLTRGRRTKTTWDLRRCLHR